MDKHPREKVAPKRFIDRAATYVTDRWFPVDPETLSTIRAGLADGRYTDDTTAFLTDLRRDVGLYTYCLRELTGELRRAGATIPLSPHELVESAGLDTLQAILAVETSAVSIHSFSSMTPVQQQRLEEALLSASTAQALGPTVGFDGDACFSAALLRQLGLTLIAWNYPSVYTDAVESIGQAGNLDLAIAAILGYTPGLLAARVVGDWGFPAEVLQTLELEESARADDEEILGACAAPTIATLCRIGERLARAARPTVYPSAERDWRSAREALEARLGPDALRVIKAIFLENCAAVVRNCPTIFTAASALDDLHSRGTTRLERLVARNPFIERCEAPLRERLEALYRALAESSDVDGEFILALAHEIAPLGGYSAGLIYTPEPGVRLLLPRLTFGAPVTHPVEPVKLEVISDPVALAFENFGPVIHEHPSPGGNIISVAGVLGYSQRVGVTYFEISAARYRSNTELYARHFRALTRSFNECLQIG